MTTCATSRRFTRGAAMAWMRGTYQGQLSRRVRSQRRGSSVKHIAAKQSGPGRDRPRRRDLVFLPPRSRPRGTEGPRIALRRAPNWLRATSRPHIAVRRSWRFARRNPSCSSSCCRPLVPRRRRLGRRPEAAHRISTRSLRADGAGSRALPLAACLRAHAFGRSIKRWLPQPRKRPASQRTPRDAVGAEEDLPQPKGGSCCAPAVARSADGAPDAVGSGSTGLGDRRAGGDRVRAALLGSGLSPHGPRGRHVRGRVRGRAAVDAGPSRRLAQERVESGPIRGRFCATRDHGRPPREHRRARFARNWHRGPRASKAHFTKFDARQGRVPAPSPR